MRSFVKKCCFCSSTTANKTGKYDVLLFGSDYFPMPVLQRLHENQQFFSIQSTVRELEVVTSLNRNKKKKHFNPVQRYCEEQKIGLHMPVGRGEGFDLKDEWEEFRRSKIFKPTPKFDLGIVCSFGYMIPTYIIEAFTHGLIVIHPSLLPRHRGASPIQYALLQNDKVTGVSFIEISKKKFDAGKILLQKTFPIQEQHTYETLSKELSEFASTNIIQILEELDTLRAESREQDESAVTPAPKFKLSDTYLDFERMDCLEVYARYRAMKGTNFSGVRSQYDNRPLFLEKVSLVTDEEFALYLSQYANARPGSVWLIGNRKYKNYFYIRCKSGWVRIEQWRPIEKIARESYKFVNQYLDKKQQKADSEGQWFMQKLL